MARITATAACFALALGLAGTASTVAVAKHVAQQETGVTNTLTAQQLMQSVANYGVWMSHPTFGWVWQPHDVEPWWQPFSVGEWIVTQDGSPYWRSAYPFGWATEHYGSWTYDQRRGWLWVPGREWSAAPVSWRATDGIVGWAPRLATTEKTQSSECPQPTFAWMFVATERVFNTTNFEVAEQELMSRDMHGTWGKWAHTQDGVLAARVPAPRNVTLLDVTNCLANTDATQVFGAAAKARGISTQGSSINFVNSRTLMGSGRAVRGQLPVYGPSIIGDMPATSDTLTFVPAESVQPLTPVTRIPPSVVAATPVAPVAPVQPVQPVMAAPVALPVLAATPATPVPAATAYAYQQSLLNQYQAQSTDAMRRMHANDATTPPHVGFDPAKTNDCHQREAAEAQREADRQRQLLAARQQDNAARAAKTPADKKPASSGQ